SRPAASRARRWTSPRSRSSSACTKRGAKRRRAAIASARGTRCSSCTPSSNSRSAWSRACRSRWWRATRWPTCPSAASTTGTRARSSASTTPTRSGSGSRSMLRYTFRRILIMIPTLLVISFITFVIIQLPPGDFLTNQIAELQSQGDKAAMEKAEFLRKQYGLWIDAWPGENGFSGLIQGDLGWSFEHDLPVKDVVGDRLLLSFILNFSVILFTWAVAFPIGFYAATRQYSWGDH